MSTRTQLRFVQRIDHETTDGEPSTTERIAQVYRHSDGYPEAVLPALQRLQALLRTTGTERGPAYTAATFVHVEKCRSMAFYLDCGPGRSITGTSRADVIDMRSWMGLDQPLFLMGYGIENPADGIHGDEEYLYVVELPRPDPIEPAAVGDWHVKVSEHSGFPRWDGPTEEAFERATWQYEGTLSGAIEELLAEPA